MWRSVHRFKFKLVLAAGVLLGGIGVGGMLRPEVSLRPVRIVSVVVFPDVPARSRYDAVVLGAPERIEGCVVRNGDCVCDAPFGTVVFPGYISCDVVRWLLYHPQEEAR